MKAVKIVLITILCGLIVFLGVVLGVGARRGTGFNHGFGKPYELAGEWEVPAAEIERLYIDYHMNSNDVYLYEGTGENIVIREYVTFKEREEWFSTIEEDGDRLIVKGRRRHFGFFSTGGFNSGAYIEIYLPSGLLQEIDIVTTSGEICVEREFAGCESFSVESSSGDIRVQRVEAEKITAGASSGDIVFHQIVGDAAIATSSGEITVRQIEGNAAVSASSGDVTLYQVEGDAAVSTSSGEIQVLGGAGSRNLSASSGSIRLADMDGIFNLHTTSGEIYVENGSGYGEARASSGDIDIRLVEMNGSLDIHTTSGEVSIYIPTEVSFSFVFDSASGECVTFFDDCLSFNRRGTSAKGDYGSSPDKKINISTSSGDVY
ncbi:MAG: DUF4097 domain-containing protein, partial [Lachnospiraceae bacterium]|nr:DUF4097 domain-containing protein [Lachnospiraceae bacterium]